MLMSEYANRKDRGKLAGMAFGTQALGLIVGPLVALALLGLRVSEATGAGIAHLGLERGHRTLTITARATRSSASKSRPAGRARRDARRVGRDPPARAGGRAVDVLAAGPRTPAGRRPGTRISAGIADR
jgi:MFS family permease